MLYACIQTIDVMGAIFFDRELNKAKEMPCTKKNSWASYKVRTLKLGGPTHVQLQCWPACLNSGSSNAGTTT